MRGKGINYDTGLSPAGHLSRPVFDPAQVEREMRDDGTDWRPKEAFHALAAAYGRTER